MSESARLRAVPTEKPYTVQFQMLFPAPSMDAAAPCAMAQLATGDGTVLDLGVVCSPTADTWSTQRHQALAEHTYANPDRFAATLTWGDTTAMTTVELAELEPITLPDYPEITFFRARPSEDNPLLLDVELGVTEVEEGHQLRVFGGAGNVREWKPIGSAENERGLTAEWTFGYPKPGPYRVWVDLMDRDGYWVTTLAEFPFAISEPIPEPENEPGDDTPSIEPRSLGTTAPIDSPHSEISAVPWLPFRYVRPMWAWARTYTEAGGSVVSRYLQLGTYIAIRQEVDVGGSLWYKTSSGDWIPSSSVADIQPSALRGVEIGGTPPLPPPDPGDGDGDEDGGDGGGGDNEDTERRGVVTANVLRVRSGPGTTYAIVDRLVFNTQVTIYDQEEQTGAIWYRIGVDRWVHGGWIRLLDPPSSPPADAILYGVVTADALNVRGRPGVSADNPPVSKLLRGARVTIYEEATSNGATWYRIGVDRWVHSGWIALVADSLIPLSSMEDNSEATVLPVGWVVSSSLHVRAQPGTSADSPVVGAVFHNQSLRILESQTVEGQKWYRIGQDQWVPGGFIGVAHFRPRPSAIHTDEKWVGVNLREQTAVAYEGDRPVYAAMVATGLSRTPTVQGIFRTWWRLISRKMSGGSPATGGYYYLEEVPWTCYFYSGYALHAAYWHDAFGRPRSHGCINLSPYDAWWIFQWSASGDPNSPRVYVYTE